MYPIYVLLVSTSNKFHSISLCELFSSYRPFWEKCTEWPPNDLEYYMLICTPYVLLVSLIPKFNSVSLYNQPFLRYRASSDKLTEWPQNDLESYKVKCTAYMYNYSPWVLNSLRFALRPTVFEIQAILRQVHRMTPNWLDAARSNYSIYV